MSPISSRNRVPPLATSKRPLLSRVRAGEGAAHVAEQLALEQGLGDRGAVLADERAGPAAGPLKWMARATSSLPGPALALDQHRDVAVRHLVEQVEDVPHPRGLARRCCVGVLERHLLLPLPQHVALHLLELGAGARPPARRGCGSAPRPPSFASGAPPADAAFSAWRRAFSHGDRRLVGEPRTSGRWQPCRTRPRSKRLSR